jgi:hypothetical protein
MINLPYPHNDPIASPILLNMSDKTGTEQVYTVIVPDFVLVIVGNQFFMPAYMCA